MSASTRLAVALAALCVALPAAAEPAPAAPVAPASVTTVGSEPVLPIPPKSVRLFVGAQLGFPQIVGFTAIGSFHFRGRPRFDVDFLWEPSAMLQSYSVGFAWHPADRMFFLGTRLRLLQLEAPWARGYDAGSDNHLGVGLEAGLRKALGPKKRVLICFTIQGTAIPTEAPQLQWLLGLSLGVSYGVLDRAIR